MSKERFLKGTLILICAGLITRFIGFFYRIFLSQAIGAQDLGIYQLTAPLQMLSLSAAAFGIQTAVSKLCAAHMAVGKSRDARDTFLLGAGLSLFLSVFLAWILYRNAGFFAVEILKEERTEPFIRLLSLGLPFSSLHICANGYYYAGNKTGIPSAIQLMEQLVRVGGTFLLYQIFLSEGKEISALIAVGGSLASEGAAALLSFLALGYDFHKHHYHLRRLAKPLGKLSDILHLSVPFSLNRILLTLLSSIEVVLLPQRLRMYGLHPDAALGIYGVLTGMVMPLLLFPSTVTNSAAVMLMPSVAKLQALGQKKRIRYAARRAGQFCFFLGCLCTLLFFFFGRWAGNFLFHSPTAGTYIQRLSFLCPFLYTNTMLSSVLNGLGKTGTCLAHSVTCILLRIGFIFFGVPFFGIRGYFYGILLGELLLCVLHIASLARNC